MKHSKNILDKSGWNVLNNNIVIHVVVEPHLHPPSAGLLAANAGSAPAAKIAPPMSVFAMFPMAYSTWSTQNVHFSYIWFPCTWVLYPWYWRQDHYGLHEIREVRWWLRLLQQTQQSLRTFQPESKAKTTTQRCCCCWRQVTDVLNRIGRRQDYRF